MATKQIAWNTGSGNITLTYQGQGNGTITVQSDDNNLGSARSQVITVETVGGAITKNFTVNQAACPFPIGEVRNYAYTGSYQEVELPAGQYKLQVWGAQGGSNGTNSTYGITAKTGGKGGYSEGIITLSQKTTIRVYVGGQGSSSAGGYNGGGSTTGTSQYNASNEFGYSKMGGGGGATDIRLSDGSLYSRMIVAGGGSGGAMCYRSKTTTTTSWESISIIDNQQWVYTDSGTKYYITQLYVTGWSVSDYIRFKISFPSTVYRVQYLWKVNGTDQYLGTMSSGSYIYKTVPSGCTVIFIQVWNSQSFIPFSSITGRDAGRQVSSTSTTTSTDYSTGKVGGGTSGGGTYPGTQTAGGNSGTFGSGQAMSTTGYRYCSGAGGGGWYGGGSAYSDSTMGYVGYSGGGSGWVNVAASAGNRPSGYTGLQLDSGETKAGNTSFPSTSGGTETGHNGNGYAKITRLA